LTDKSTKTRIGTKTGKRNIEIETKNRRRGLAPTFGSKSKQKIFFVCSRIAPTFGFPLTCYYFDVFAGPHDCARRRHRHYPGEPCWSCCLNSERESEVSNFWGLGKGDS
jgi:hypothetical protein